MSTEYNPETAQLDEEERYYEDHYEEFHRCRSFSSRRSYRGGNARAGSAEREKQMVSIRLAPDDVNNPATARANDMEPMRYLRFLFNCIEHFGPASVPWRNPLPVPELRAYAGSIGIPYAMG